MVKIELQLTKNCKIKNNLNVSKQQPLNIPITLNILIELGKKKKRGNNTLENNIGRKALLQLHESTQLSLVSSIKIKKTKLKIVIIQIEWNVIIVK